VPERFFTEVTEPIAFRGTSTDDPLAFRWYDAERMVGDRTMAEHLRFAVCYWHSFCWGGSDVFGGPTFDRPWIDATGDPMGAARQKLDAAFEFFELLGAPFFCFHDTDVAPEADSFAETAKLLDEIADDIAAHMERSGVRLLWGTANLFAHPRYMAGAATNPDADVFAYAAAQVAHCLEVTHRLGGANYVLWGGREGYETLLNTDLRREQDQLARFLSMVVEHKHKIGFGGTILIEPKPAEPTKHQYDHDVAAVVGFLDHHNLLGEVKLNIEVNHATLAGHSFHHEVAAAVAAGALGSIDANRGDPQNGWDTDQFPNSVEELSLALVEVLRAGGLTTGGFNFDTKLRRQSVDRTDLFHGHVGAMDTVARALLVAQAAIDDGALDRARQDRYASWGGELGRRITAGGATLDDLRDEVIRRDLRPVPRSGRQEALENIVSRFIWET
jgi:xylose isomerase